MTTINFRGQLLDLTQPQVVGILNVTPDSFYAASRTEDVDAVRRRADAILAEGAAMIDVGACSTRPGSTAVSEDEEMRRLAMALEAIRRDHPEAIVSIDTFRSRVARRCIEDFGPAIINDISGGESDKSMFQVVADLAVPYILTHNLPSSSPSPSFSPSLPPSSPSPSTAPGDFVAGSPAPSSSPSSDALLASVARFFAERLQRLHSMGVADVILDPGFGFGKTLEENYLLMCRLPDLVHTFDGYPLMVGVSRKSMVWRLLGTAPEEALTGTTVLHTLSLQAGAHLLRVHDVRAAVETIHVWQAASQSSFNRQKVPSTCSLPSA